MRTTAKEHDPIFEVTGIAAAHILQRCALIRGSQIGDYGERSDSITPLYTRRADAIQRDKGVSLACFAIGSNNEFIDLVYVALTGRKAQPKEAAKGLSQLSAGMTRLHIIMRVLSSHESRDYHPNIRGTMFLILATLAHFGGKISKSAMYKAPARNMQRLIRRPSLREKTTGIMSAVADILVTLPKIGKMRREIKELKNELAKLKAKAER